MIGKDNVKRSRQIGIYEEVKMFDCDFAETVRWWMKNGKYSPEEIAGFFLETVRFENS